MVPPPRNRLTGRSGPRRSSADHSSPEERILCAAVALFADCGFSGASTRDIARRAQVNEASVYRYFASKHALFEAALGRELRSLRAQLEALPSPVDAESPRGAIRRLFRFTAGIVTRRPKLMRLLQFSALEFGTAMKPVYRAHLSAILSAATEHLPCRSPREAPSHADLAVLSGIATLVAAQTFYSVFARAPLPAAAAKAMTEIFAEVWCAALSCDESGREIPIPARARNLQR